jgi:low-density lipoprotein receptor-related protein 4
LQLSLRCDLLRFALTGLIYWSDISSDVIQSSCLNGSCTVQNVIEDGLDTVDGLAIDVIGRLMYWTDAIKNHIEVISLTRNIRSVLIWDDLDSPRGIALHYDAGLVN